jgi:hypothetical protein
MLNPHEMEVAMTRTMLRDALSALAEVTRVSAATCGQASAQSKFIMAYQAKVALDAVRRRTGPALRRPVPGENWRWWQDYGRGTISPAPGPAGTVAVGREQGVNLTRARGV